VSTSDTPTQSNQIDTSASKSYRFVLYREEDVSGVSTQFIAAQPAIVAEGTLLTNGRVSLTWLSPMVTVAAYDGMDVVQALHGHGGKTRVHWIDKPPLFKEFKVYYRIFMPEPHPRSYETGELKVEYCLVSNRALERAIRLVEAKFPGGTIEEISLLSR
jgi:hypothetical protein